MPAATQRKIGSQPYPSSTSCREPERREPRTKGVPANRALLVADIENLMGGPFTGHTALRAALRSMREVAHLRPTDHVILGCNPRLASEVALLKEAPRLVVRQGPDGADLALLETIADYRWIAARYDRVIIGSGDGIFAFAAAQLVNLGITVGVVARKESLSGALANKATYVRLLPPPFVGLQLVA